MVEEKSKQKFIDLISKFLDDTNLGFQHPNSEEWILERVISGGKIQVAANGQPPVEVQQPDQTTKFKVEIVGEGDIRDVGAPEPGDEFLQIRFSVIQNEQTVRELEDCIFIQDRIGQFRSTFMEVFS